MKDLSKKTAENVSHGGSGAWSAVLAMALCVALLIASEFMPVSLLTPMAASLHATVGQTGQAISVSGFFAVAASLLVTTIAGMLNRKWVLIGLTGCMLISLIMVASTPDFLGLLLGRALLGICIGGFWALATAVIMRLVPEDEISHALGIMYGGQAAAAAFAAPIGSYLGSLFGWRTVFWALVPVVILNIIWLLGALPSLPVRQRQSFRGLFELLRQSYFLRGLIGAMLSWGAAFTLFTYLRPFLEKVTGVSVQTLSILLLILGCAGFVGTWAAGYLAKSRISGGLKIPVMVQGACTLGLLLGGHSLVVVVVVMAVWGAMNTAMSVIWMTWLAQNVGKAAEEGGALMVAAIQLSILLGAVFGGFLLDHFSISVTLVGSILLAVLGCLVIGSGRALLKP
ncbi:MFS transporter [Oecophyllibacter saccharovorans]|nr:MFS transporter [Oecophyllibacter saccharovorans]